MPRKGKGNRTLSGASGQGAKAPVGVPYGEGERALESQRRMPVPSGPAPVPGGAGGPSGAGGPPAGGPSGGPPPDLGMALAAAQGMAPPSSVLGEPTARPGEPLTTGMEQLGKPLPEVNEGLYNLRAIYKRAPNEDLRKLIEYIERGL